MVVSNAERLRAVSLSNGVSPHLRFYFFPILPFPDSPVRRFILLFSCFYHLRPQAQLAVVAEHAAE
jgi:hypothetical protein